MYVKAMLWLSLGVHVIATPKFLSEDLVWPGYGPFRVAQVGILNH